MSRSYALIDGWSRQNFYKSKGNVNMAFWDDPSYQNPPSKLKDNQGAFTDGVVERELIDPQKSDRPYLSHQEITRIVSNQFAGDLRERSSARDSVGGVGFALVFVASLLPAMGIMDITLYAQLAGNATCLKPTNYQAPLTAVWIWITGGIWCSIVPLALGMMLVFSKQSSNADHTHTFDPVLKDDGGSGKTKSSNRRYDILTYVSIVSLILGIISAVIDIVLFVGCLSDLVFKVIPSVVICPVAVVIIVILVVQLRARRKKNSQNSNYDRRNYDITLNHGRYAPKATEADAPKRIIQTEAAPPPPAASVAPQVSQPLVTIIEQPPVYPVMALPPPPPQPFGPSIFAGAGRLPVRGARYQRPLYYQMPY